MSSRPIPPPFPFVEYWPHVFAAGGNFAGSSWLCPRHDAAELVEVPPVFASTTAPRQGNDVAGDGSPDRELQRAARLWRKNPERVAHMIMDEEIGSGVFEDESGQLVELRLSEDFRKMLEERKAKKVRQGGGEKGNTGKSPRKTRQRGRRGRRKKGGLVEPGVARRERLKTLRETYGSLNGRRLAGLEDELNSRYANLASKKKTVQWPSK